MEGDWRRMTIGLLQVDPLERFSVAWPEPGRESWLALARDQGLLTDF
jgi:hypothetical protein